MGEDSIMDLIVITFGLIGISLIAGLGILGCIAIIEESEYRKYKARYDDERI